MDRMVLAERIIYGKRSISESILSANEHLFVTAGQCFTELISKAQL